VLTTGLAFFFSFAGRARQGSQPSGQRSLIARLSLDSASWAREQQVSYLQGFSVLLAAEVHPQISTRVSSPEL
jgi:hypothetical protein